MDTCPFFYAKNDFLVSRYICDENRLEGDIHNVCMHEKGAGGHGEANEVREVW